MWSINKKLYNLINHTCVKFPLRERFCPISLLTSFSKILKRIIYVKLHKYINNNGILSNEQYEFRRNLPTEIASHKLNNEVLQALSGRHILTYRVLINTKMSYLYTSSDWGRIKHGVPQGSILVPPLFLLYINDLPKVINNKSKTNISANNISIIIIIMKTNPIN